MKKINNKTKRSFAKLRANSSLPELEFDLLFSYLSKKKREKLLSHPEITLNKKNYKELIKLEKKRLKHWPIAYLIKEKGFFNLKLKVSPAVLIPRPETETLVTLLIKKINSLNEKTNIIDIGCGSGAIIISLAKNLNNTKRINFFASDISLPALKVAKENTKKYKLEKKITFKSGDLLKPWRDELKLSSKERIVITANLPYLKPKEMVELSIGKEPKKALLSGRDGLYHYRKLFLQLSSFIKNDKGINKENIFLICEINPQQAKTFIKIVKENFNQSKIKLEKDLNKKIRFVLVSL